MADTKITSLVELSSGDVNNSDVLPIVDVSDTAQASTGSTKKITKANFLSGHTHTVSQVTDAGTAATKDFPAAGDAASGEVVLGNDGRLTDARAPSGAAGGDLSGTYANPTVAKIISKIIAVSSKMISECFFTFSKVQVNFSTVIF